jgi:hypothetical protein
VIGEFRASQFKYSDSHLALGKPLMNRCLISFAAKQFVWLIILAAAIFSAGTAYAVPPPLNPGETQYNPALNPLTCC